MATKKIIKKKTEKKVGVKKETPLGVVTHFYTKIKVAIVKFKKSVKAGTEVRFEGNSTKFSQKIVSIQYDHKPIATAPKGKQVGIKVIKKVREGDTIYLS